MYAWLKPELWAAEGKAVRGAGDMLPVYLAQVSTAEGWTVDPVSLDRLNITVRGASEGRVSRCRIARLANLGLVRGRGSASVEASFA